MAMSILNNGASMSVLGELKKNDVSLGKQLKKVASGMKLHSAGDGAAEFAISERMRVRLRALDQDEENVQTGASMLHTTEGGVQEQIDILKTIKQKVIDANNDTNTDLDRATIQKEIDQGYDQIQDIATETMYNNRRVLFGGTTIEKVAMWEVKTQSELVPESDAMSVIPDKYGTLDGVAGPFDIFEEYTTKAATMTTIGLQSSQKYSGAASGSAGTYVVDFSKYKKASDLDGVGIQIRGYNYAFTTDPSKYYNRTDYTVDISKCTTVDDAVAALAKKYHPYATMKASGKQLTVTTDAKSSSVNNWKIQGYPATETKTKDQTTTVEERKESPKTGFFTPTKRLSGGVDQVGSPGSTDPDSKYTPSKQASLTVKMPGLAVDSGITMTSYSTNYLKFVSGNSGFQYDSKLGIYTVGINANASQSISGMTVKYSNGTITFTSNTAGTTGNSYSVSDGIPSRKASSTTTKGRTYHAVTPWNGTVDNKNTGKDGTRATYTIDLSGLPNSTDPADAEDVIGDLRGKSFVYDGSYRYNFIDSADDTSLASSSEGLSGTTIDLNALRSMVGGTTTVRSALSSLLLSKLSRSSAATDGSGNVVLTSSSVGDAGNNTTLSVYTSTYRHYDIDYGQWFKDNAGARIPDDLYDKGFHFYCATDASQWFNVLFTNGDAYEKDRPKSGTAGEDIKTMQVDVSKVKTAADLVTAIYDQTMPLLTGPDKNYNHHYRIAAEPSTGVLTVYDKRRYNVNTAAYDYQERGAKIADGVMDNVIKNEKDILVDRVIIHHTDKASQNIQVDLPRTTLDQIFMFIEGKQNISDYNVMTKAMREQLLGMPPSQGILDKGLEYLTNANTVIGAQTNHLAFAHANIKAQQEGTQASESAIRDADMAQEMVGYTKANILASTAQSMLAQANQSAGRVLNLLQ